jgi:hypothetical protein
MRNIIMLGSFIALLGFGSVGLAVAQTNPSPSDAVQTQDTPKAVGGDRLDRHEAKERAGDHRDRQSREEQDESRERHERR